MNELKLIELIKQERMLRDELDDLYDDITSSTHLFGKKWNMLEEKLKEWIIFRNQEVKIL